MWKAGLVEVRWASERRGRNLRDSMNDPGPVLLSDHVRVYLWISVSSRHTTMHKEERHCALDLTLLMNEMNI